MHWIYTQANYIHRWGTATCNGLLFHCLSVKFQKAQLLCCMLASLYAHVVWWALVPCSWDSGILRVNCLGGQVKAVHGVCRTQILHLTLFCRSTFAPAESRSCIASLWTWKLAHMRAVMPIWGTQWEQNSDNTCWWTWTSRSRNVHFLWGNKYLRQ